MAKATIILSVAEKSRTAKTFVHLPESSSETSCSHRWMSVTNNDDVVSHYLLQPLRSQKVEGNQITSVSCKDDEVSFHRHSSVLRLT